jgi:hypothetical protein
MLNAGPTWAGDKRGGDKRPKEINLGGDKPASVWFNPKSTSVGSNPRYKINLGTECWDKRPKEINLGGDKRGGDKRPQEINLGGDKRGGDKRPGADKRPVQRRAWFQRLRP